MDWQQMDFGVPFPALSSHLRQHVQQKSPSTGSASQTMLSPISQVLEDSDAEAPTGTRVTAVVPTEPGRLMAHHCINVKTMATICTVPKGAGMGGVWSAGSSVGCCTALLRVFHTNAGISHRDDAFVADSCQGS